MGKRKDKRKKTEKLDRASTPSRSNTNVTTEADVTYYNIPPPSASRASRSSHSNDGHIPTSSTATAHKADTASTNALPSGAGGGGGGGVETAVSSSSSSSSSSSTTTSDTESLWPSQLALVPRPPGFNPYMMGFPPGQVLPPGYGAGMYGMQMGGYCPPYGGHPSMMGGGQQMLPFQGHGGQGSGFMPGAIMPTGGMGPPARYDNPYDADRTAVLHQHHVASKHHHQHELLIMEHPSLRQCVIFMAIVFVIALVALIVTAIYFGKTTETTWKI